MNTLKNIWMSAFNSSPDQIAVIDEDKRRTYRQVMERAYRLGSALYEAGLRKQSRVAMLAMNCAEWYDVYAASNLFGFIVTTVNFRLAPPEIQFILNDSASKMLIYEKQYEPLIEKLKQELRTVERYICIDSNGAGQDDYESFIASGSPIGPPISASPSSYSHLIYTSGTTGRPKGVIRTQQADAANARECAMFMGMHVGGSLLLVMPLFHIGALGESHAQILCRGTVVLRRQFDPVDVLQTLERERIDFTHMAPTMVQACLDAPNCGSYDLSRLKTLCYAAAPMPVSVLKRALERFGPVLLNCYGSTEVSAATALHKIFHQVDGSDVELARLSSVGQALPHCEIRILDAQGEQLGPDATGEVSIRSDSALEGYWNNDIASIEALSDGWFATGDMGYLDHQGFLYLVDRKKDMIISGGENIYCREVEEALMDHGTLIDVAVIGVPDEYWGESVRAIAVVKDGANASAEALIEHCLKRIARYKKPKSIVFVDSLPRLPSGKVNKVTLRETYGGTIGR